MALGPGPPACTVRPGGMWGACRRTHAEAASRIGGPVGVCGPVGPVGAIGAIGACDGAVIIKAARPREIRHELLLAVAPAGVHDAARVRGGQPCPALPPGRLT